jgi:uncharacterized protein YdaT
MKTVKEINERFSISNLPDQLRDIASNMQEQAIDAANSLMEQGYKAPIAATLAAERFKGWSNLSGETLPYHVVPREDGWAVVKADSEQAIAVTDTKQQAVDRGREVARNQRGRLMIHGEDGMVQDEHSYEGA